MKGSPTVLETFRGYRHAGGPLGHHREWVRTSHAQGKRPHLHEHYTLCAAIELLTCFDQVHMPCLIGAELLMRRLQLIESAYEISRDGKSPDFFHAEEMMGTLRRPSGAVIANTLEQEAGERLKQRAEIEKQLKKAKEATRTPPAGNGGAAKS